MRSALVLLRTQEDRRAALIQSLKDAEEESERDGYIELEDALAAMDATISAAEVARPDSR